MSNYSEKTTKLLKVFASYLSTQKIDEEFASDALAVFGKKFENYESEKFEDKTIADLRMVLLDNGEVKRIFPSIPTANKKEFDKTHEIIKNFVSFEAGMLVHIFKKDNIKMEDIKQFISFTYRPLRNTTGHPALLSSYFIVSVFIMNDGSLEYTVKPNIQYVLTEEHVLNEEDLLKLL